MRGAWTVTRNIRVCLAPIRRRLRVRRGKLGYQKKERKSESKVAHLVRAGAGGLADAVGHEVVALAREAPREAGHAHLLELPVGHGDVVPRPLPRCPRNTP